MQPMVNIMKNKRQSLVSIVMATYNGEKFIAEQIDSILTQTYKNIELIICDDGSTDNTIEIVKEYMSRHDMIKLYQNFEPYGFVKNFEKGIGLSTAKYIALCDQDDIWEGNKLQLSMHEMYLRENKGLELPVMVHSDLSIIDENNHTLYHSYFKFKHYALKQTKDLGHIIGPCGVMGNTILFNQPLKEKILPFPSCIAFHDHWIALINEVSGIRVTIEKPLVRYRVHKGNNSNPYDKINTSVFSTMVSFFKGEIIPPYINSKRVCMIEYIVKYQSLKNEDQQVFSDFMDYLLQKGSKWKQFYSLLHHNILKRDFWYRAGFFMNFFLYKDNKKKRLYFFGFSLWKRYFIKSFFPSNNKIIFCDALQVAIDKDLQVGSEIYIWGKKIFDDVEIYAKENNIALFRVEDGFIRSVSLGSDLTKAYSIVVDSRGIYFDPAQESDLENILNTYTFDTEIIHRAKKLQLFLLENKISKYNIDQEKKIILKDLQKDQKVILVPGQVEDDASIKYGADGMTNLELLKKVKVNAPEAYIIYKPHPDVLAGNRKGHVEHSDAKIYCNVIVEKTSLDSILRLSDEVHTMTSLFGFETLIRGKKVYTYGLPFYAGWGLTVDTKRISRRKRLLSLDELVAATLILYPKYINPANNKTCEIEVLLDEIDKEKRRYNKNGLYKVYRDSRNLISRKMQRLIKVLKDE